MSTAGRFAGTVLGPPKLAETRNVGKVVARLVLYSLQKIPRGRLTSALPSYTANETEEVFKWHGDLMLPTRLPVSVSVYVVDVPDAEMKAQELKLTIKAER